MTKPEHVATCHIDLESKGVADTTCTPTPKAVHTQIGSPLEAHLQTQQGYVDITSH